jgi:hypothetical protein
VKNPAAERHGIGPERLAVDKNHIEHDERLLEQPDGRWHCRRSLHRNIILPMNIHIMLSKQQQQTTGMMQEPRKQD